MKRGCPNIQCSFHASSKRVVKNGVFYRANDSRTIQRYKCRHCGKRFSKSTGELEYRQKKRRINRPLFHLYCSGVSMRRMAKILNINRLTVKRRLIYLAKRAVIYKKVLYRQLEGKVTRIQLDDLITIEHTKLRPLSVSTVVSEDRKLLDVQVSQIPAFGLLAERSRRKYGRRKSAHLKALNRLFQNIGQCLDPNVVIESDKHKNYPPVIQKHTPDAIHKTYNSIEGCVVGQGELKKTARDPLFIINHTLAMLRANINRLFRRSWCTTKDPQMLQNHLDVFLHYFNTELVA